MQPRGLRREVECEGAAQWYCRRIRMMEIIGVVNIGGKHSQMTTVDAPDPLVTMAVETFVVRRKPLPAPTAQTQAPTSPPPAPTIMQTRPCEQLSSPCLASHIFMPPAPSAPRDRPHVQPKAACTAVSRGRRSHPPHSPIASLRRGCLWTEQIDKIFLHLRIRRHECVPALDMSSGWASSRLPRLPFQVACFTTTILSTLYRKSCSNVLLTAKVMQAA